MGEHHTGQGVSSQPTPLDTFRTAQYTALKSEECTLIGIGYQLTLADLVAAGTFLSIGIQSYVGILLVYPLLALLIGAAWAENQFARRQIEGQIENVLAKLGATESIASGSNASGETWRMRLSHMGPRALFVVTQGVSVVLYWVKKVPSAGPSEHQGLAMVFDGIAIVITLVLVFTTHRPAHKPVAGCRSS